MKKVGCITFHASHNYGSVLQAYALQEFVKQNFENIEYKIINLRTKRQKGIYSVFPKDSSIKYRIFVLLNYFHLRKKYNRFENFINTKLNLTEEFENENISEDKFDFDFYISGGDQIWNVSCADFSWLYYPSYQEYLYIKINQCHCQCGFFYVPYQPYNNDSKSYPYPLL